MTADQIQPGQRVKIPRFSKRITVDVTAVESTPSGRTVILHGRRVTRTARDRAMGPEYCTVSRPRCFSLGPTDTVEIVR